MRIAAAAASVCALLAGCQEGRPLQLELPPVPPNGTLLIAAEREVGVGCGDRLVQQALDIATSGQRLDIVWEEPDRPLRVSVLVYDERADRLGLPLGELTSPAAGEACLPPPSKKAYRQTLTGGRAGSWDEISERAAVERCFCVPRIAPTCDLFEPPVRVPLDRSRMVSFMLPIEPDRLLVGTTSAALFLVDARGATFMATTSSKLAGGMRASDGSLWFGGEAGEIWRGRYTGTALELDRVSTSPRAGLLRWLAGRPEASPPELYVLSEQGALEKFDGTTWTLLHQFEKEDTRAGLTAVGPGDVYAVHASSPEIVHVEDGVPTNESTAEQGQGICAIGDVPGFGIVAGATRGFLYHRSAAGVFEPMNADETSRADFHVRVFIPYESGSLYAGGSGLVGYHAPGRGTCAAMKLGMETLHTAGRLGRAVLLGGLRAEGLEHLELTLLRPKL